MGAPLGNTNAAKEHRRFSEALNRAIAQDDSKRLRKAVEVLLDKASEGEYWALNMLADRLEGKPGQQVNLGGEVGLKLAKVRTGVPDGG